MTEPILEHTATRKPGDLDLLLVPELDDPSRAISVQAKRVKVEAISSYRDDISNRQLGNLTYVIEQANGSREFGFHLNYAMVILQIDGAGRTDFNFLASGTTSGQFKNIYDRVWNSPPHADVGMIFVEISQPTPATIDKVGLVAICVDRRATPIEQPTSLTERVRQLIQHTPSL